MEDNTAKPVSITPNLDELHNRKFTYLDMINAFYAGCDYRHSLLKEVIAQYGVGSQPDFREYMRQKFLSHDQDLTAEAVKNNPLNSL